MKEISEITKTLGGMPTVALLALVVLAGFGLAAYAIYAVTSVRKEGR